MGVGLGAGVLLRLHHVVGVLEDRTFQVRGTGATDVLHRGTRATWRPVIVQRAVPFPPSWRS